ncbi:MAG: RNA 2',3'-cyclic phosphodiesterase [Proteobacteria bacterium]|nr:RNA 2',3'-cyclic phosphodiesterase [Pseudomonadota bacterium]
MVRLFVGLSLPESTRERLVGFFGGVPGARWIKPENMHITVKFIGDVENGVAEDIALALHSVLAERFQVMLRGSGCFGKGAAARNLWVGIEPCKALSHLRIKVETALQAVGIPREARKFTPHITLARLRKSPANRVESFVADHCDFAEGPIEVTQFVLFSSFLSASGALYTPEVTYQLNS